MARRKRLTIAKTRSALYLISRLLGDAQAVQQDRVPRRVARRAAGKATGRLFRKLFG